MAKETSVTCTGVTPYLCVHDGEAALDFYKRAFGAEEKLRLTDDQGRVAHAEIRIGKAVIFLDDEYPEINVLSPKSVGGTSVMMVLDVDDTDLAFERAVQAGATVARPPQDGFDGDLRTAVIYDPFDHRWMFATERPGLGDKLKQSAETVEAAP